MKTIALLDRFHSFLRKSAVITFITSLVTATAFSQAALKTLTDEYQRQRVLLTAAFDSQIKPARDRYLAALTAAQKAATTAVRTVDLAAIDSELQGITANCLPETTPPDLPRTLVPDRKTLVTALAAATRILIPKQRELATAYLRNLATLELNARKASDQPLIDATVAEKQRAIAELESAGGGQKNRNVVENGDFSLASNTGFPLEWIKAHQWKEVSDVTVVTEGRDKFLRFRRLQSNIQSDLAPAKAIGIPARARFAEVTFRMRVEAIVKGKEYDPWPGVHLSARDGRNEKLASAEAILKENSGWRRMTARVNLPDGTKTLNVSLGPFGAAGIVDFDDVAVEFK